jgi:hypothetical protein
MPIDVRVDHPRRLVVARASGVLTDGEVFAYQQGTWSRAEVAGYDELADMTGVVRIELPSAARARELASVSAGMDRPGAPSRLAIVAPQDQAFGLGRMYQAFREMDPRSAKEVAVFRTAAEALAFLGVKGPLALDDGASAGPGGAPRAEGR